MRRPPGFAAGAPLGFAEETGLDDAVAGAGAGEVVACGFAQETAINSPIDVAPRSRKRGGIVSWLIPLEYATAP